MTSGSALEASITLEDVFTVVQAKRVPLAPELAGYLALEIAEGADASCDVDPRAVYIGEEGTVGLVRQKNASGNAEASIRTILARLLDVSGSQTPALSGSAKRKPGTGLPALVEELEAALIPVNRAAGRRALARLAREVKRVTLGVGRNASIPAAQELRPMRASSPSHHAVTPPPPSTREKPEPEAPPPPPRSVRPPTPPASFGAEEENPTRASRDSMIPPQVLSQPPPGDAPNDVHDASELPTRVLEPKRPQAPSQPDPVDQLIASFEVSKKTDAQVARDLKAMIGLEPTPPPPNAAAADGDVEALLSMTEPSEPTPPPPPRRASAASIPDAAPEPAPEPPISPREPVSARDVDERQLPTGPSHLKVARAVTKDRAPSSNNGLIVFIVAFFVLAAGAIALWRLKPGFFSGRTKEKVEAEKAQNEADKQKMLLAQQAASCKATLVVTDVPSNAEVLLRVGQAPADVERMPVGTRLEFVATAEGYAPKRAVIPAGAAWESSSGATRFELAVQLDKSKAKPGQVDLWPPAEPGSEVGGKGPPGTVHIVSTPRGAEVWLLAGIGPEAKIEALRCDADVDVLVAGPTTLRKRLHVAAGDFAKDGAARVARVSAK